MIAQTYARVVVFFNIFFELAHLLHKVTAAAAAATPYVADGAATTDAADGAAAATEAAAS